MLSWIEGTRVAPENRSFELGETQRQEQGTGATGTEEHAVASVVHNDYLERQRNSNRLVGHRFGAGNNRLAEAEADRACTGRCC